MDGNNSLIVSLIFLFFVIIIANKFLPKRINSKRYVKRWIYIQSLCHSKETWPDAIMASEKLLKKAVTTLKFKGKNMGEKLTNGQHSFTDNNALWISYKIYKKLDNDSFNLREADVKKALVGFRQALRDLGALPDEKK